MNKIRFLLRFLRPWRGTKQASGREDRSHRRSRHLLEFESSRRLESRQLLANFSVTYSATVPTQPTDYTAPITLPKFSPSLGTLTEVDLSFSASGTQGGTLTNVATTAQDFTFQEDVNLAIQDGSTTLISPDLVASQPYTGVAPNAAVPFGPYSPTKDAAAIFTTGPTFDQFAGGPGNVNLTVQTFSTQTINGGGGNIRATINTTAGGVATVVYRYTATPVSVSGNVYDDVTGTGTLAPGDKPIPGTLLTLLDSTGTTVATTTTAADGTYSFTTTASGGPLVPGTYSVAETQPAGYLQGTNTVGTVNGVTDGALTGLDVIGSIVLTSGQASIGNNFGELLPVSLAGNVYEDVNGTGVLSPGDKPIPGTLLTLLNSSGAAVATTTTDAVGTYSFTTTASGGPLVPGTYSVAETQPAGYLQGTNTVGTVNGVTDGALTGLDVIGSIVLHSGQASIGNNFGELLPVTLSGVVYVDQAHAGKFVPGDPPIPGVTVTLFNAGGEVATTTTNILGGYAFTTTSAGAPLPPSTYTIVETQPAGYLQGTNTVGTVNGVTVGMLGGIDVIDAIALTSAQDTINNDFGELLPVVTNANVTDVQRFGVHLQPSLVVLTFDTPLDPSTAQNVANYRIFGPTDSKHPALVPVESATYNPATNMVTLRLGERLDVHHPYRLTVTGLRTTTGGLLVGSNGQPGSPYVTTLNRSSLSGFTDIYGNFVPINHGKLYPAASASGYQLKRFVQPANLGPFASANKATFLAATAGAPETPPIDYLLAKKAKRQHGHG